jgi:hypothetical protein
MLGVKISRDMQGLAGLRGRIQMRPKLELVLIIEWSELMRGSSETRGCVPE